MLLSLAIRLIQDAMDARASRASIVFSCRQPRAICMRPANPLNSASALE
jgi:hypothetical protein